MAAQLGGNRPLLVTTLKPEGTLSLLPTVSSGVHYSHSPYYIRRVRITATDPLCRVCEELGYPVLPEVGQDPEDPTTKVLEFPVKAPAGRVKGDVTAIEQLEIWTQRSGVEIVKHKEGADPAAVVYDSIEAAKARHADILLIDTAGRLHNKKNLMDELGKMFRIVSQRAEGCDVETLLVLDATTGQNAVNQAEQFMQAANITGIVLTKLDGTAKGGIVVSIKNQLGLPVRYVGVGEKIDDLQEFVPEDFVEALFE